MTNIADLLSTDDPFGLQPVEGVIVSAPADTTTLVMVIVPSFDSSQPLELRWGPRGDDLPTPGDQCLVVFTKDGTAWVGQWWPS